MPEKVHSKFDETAERLKSSPGEVESKIQPNPKTNSENSPRKTSIAGHSNGLKRSQDGKPKSSHSNSSRDSDANSKKSDSSYDENGRARKSPKLNGLIATKSQANVNSIRPRQESNPAGRVNGNAPPRRPSEQELKRTAKNLEKTRMRLPVWLKKMDIRWDLRHHDVLLLNGETGSGKSTQVPQFLCTEPWCTKRMVTVEDKTGRKQEANVGGMIAITQPRRIAAITLARRVAAEMGEALDKGSVSRGEGTVGYAVRFDHQVPRGAKIKFVTEGILLQEMLSDPQLRQYSAIIIDEIHERSMDVDLIAGFLRNIVHGDKKGRGGIPLKVVIMSATLDKGGIEAFFAKPESRSDYETGRSHEDPVKKTNSSSESRRSSMGSEFSAWSGISDSPQGNSPTDRTANTTPTPKSPQGTSGRRSSIPDKKNKSLPEASKDGKLTNGTVPQKEGNEPPFKKGDQNMISNGTSSKKEGNGIAKSAEVPEGEISPNGVAWEYIRGRQYEVQTSCEKVPVEDYQHAMLENILQLHTSEPLPGDILAFLTGQDEIESLQAELEKYSAMLASNVPRIEIKPLHGSLSPQEQEAAFVKTEKKFTRKVVLATNIAETSLTVAGVRYVVDCGKAKVKQYRPHLGMESLLIKPISKVSAIQRAGRAGREAKGKCYRIYTNEEFKKMEQDEKPEIMRCNVIEAVLKMKARGVEDVLSFPLMDSPDVTYMEKALNHLYSMNALDSSGALTTTGKQMSKFPLPATHGRVLIAAAEESSDCLLEVIDILACLNTDSEVFRQPKSEEEHENMMENRSDVYRREGDLITLLTTMQRYASENTNRNHWCERHLISVRAMKLAYTIRKQLRTICIDNKLLTSNPPADPQLFEPITPEKAMVVIKTFLKAFVKETAILGPDGGFRTMEGRETIHIHPSSVLHGRKLEAIMFLQHVYTTKNYAKKVCAIQADWIAECYGL